jgi:hypothetical protein
VPPFSRGKSGLQLYCNRHLPNILCRVDLRRTYRTTHAKIGTPPHIAERLVNHVSVTSPVSKIYDRYSYLPEMRKAVEAYETHLAAVLAQKQSVPRAA